MKSTSKLSKGERLGWLSTKDAKSATVKLKRSSLTFVSKEDLHARRGSEHQTVNLLVP